MATHSSVLACRIPGTAEPGGLPSVGSHRVGHDWSDLAAAAAHASGTEPALCLVWNCSPALDQLSTNVGPGKRWLEKVCSKPWGPAGGGGEGLVARGAGVGEQRPDRMWAFIQFSVILCSHVTGGKTWRLRALPHLLLPDNHSQSRVGTGPGPAGRRDRHPSPGSVARSPSSSRRCGSQALQIVQPLCSTLRA